MSHFFRITLDSQAIETYSCFIQKPHHFQSTNLALKSLEVLDLDCLGQLSLEVLDLDFVIMLMYAFT